MLAERPGALDAAIEKRTHAGALVVHGLKQRQEYRLESKRAHLAGPAVRLREEVDFPGPKILLAVDRHHAVPQIDVVMKVERRQLAGSAEQVDLQCVDTPPPNRDVFTLKQPLQLRRVEPLLLGCSASVRTTYVTRWIVVSNPNRWILVTDEVVAKLFQEAPYMACRLPAEAELGLSNLPVEGCHYKPEVIRREITNVKVTDHREKVQLPSLLLSLVGLLLDAGREVDVLDEAPHRCRLIQLGRASDQAIVLPVCQNARC